MDIKILFTDLDGTLVEHAGDVTQDAIKAARKLINADIELMIVTGRHPDMTRSIHYNLGLKTPVIGCNGSVIKDLTDNRILYINELPADVVKRSIQIARDLGVDWVVYEQNNIFFEKMPPKSYQMPYKNSGLPEYLRANFIKINSEEELFRKEHVFLKSLFLFDNRKEAMEEGKELLERISGIDILRSADTYIDVMAKGSSKGNSVKIYLDMVNVKRECIAAIGDAQNDIDMLEYAEVGIAMGNAVDSVKAIAQRITSKYPDGFNDAVEYLINIKD